MRIDVKQRDMARLSEYRDQLAIHPKLTYLFFELTDACNLSCLHCGSSACPQNKTYLSESSIKKVLVSVAQKYDPSQIMICLTGGEPLMHPSFFSIASLARRMGFSCGTNLRHRRPKRKSIGFLPHFACFSVLFRPKTVLLRAVKPIISTYSEAVNGQDCGQDRFRALICFRESTPADPHISSLRLQLQDQLSPRHLRKGGF